MIVINHKFLQSEILSEIKSIEEIRFTPANSTLIFDFTPKNIEICNYCNKNSLLFGIKVKNIKEIIFSANLNAKYLLLKDRELAIKAQKIADNYMYEAKVILEIESEDELEWCALNGIDGVLFKES